jgi:hypothetical protein
MGKINFPSSIWIVCGATGCYSDAEEWVVCASLTKEKAEEITKELNDWCVAHGCEEQLTWRGANRPDEKPEADPQFQCDHTGVWYGCYEVEIR